ncbi:ClpP/crotonase-like domain-containing protein, partial [Macrophomina phaseolina]
MSQNIILSVQGHVAVITLNRPKVFNALSLDDYQLLARLMRQAAEDRSTTVTVLTGRGKYFSAGADLTSGSGPADPSDPKTRKYWLNRFAAGNADVTKAFYEHPKVLVCALNGPAVGLTAALAAHADFVFASPTTFLLTPFAQLGLVAEGASSHAFTRRLGRSLASAALLASQRIPASALLACGFVNEIVDGDDFLSAVMQRVDALFGPAANLDRGSLLKIKALITRGEREQVEAANVVEHWEGLARFADGIPQAYAAR